MNSGLAVVDQGTGEIVAENLKAIAALNAALAKAQADFPAIGREREVKVETRTGGSYSYKYAPLDVIFGAVRKPLTENGLALVQLLDGDGIRTELRHSEGGVIGASFPLPTMPEKPQELGSMLTYLRRYAVMAILGIATEEDDDGAAAQRGTQDGGEKRTTAQNKKIFALINDLETLKALPPQPHPDWKVATDARCHELFNHGIAGLTKDEAHTLIEAMKAHVKSLMDQAEKPGFEVPAGAQEKLVPETEETPF